MVAYRANTETRTARCQTNKLMGNAPYSGRYNSRFIDSCLNSIEYVAEQHSPVDKAILVDFIDRKFAVQYRVAELTMDDQRAFCAAQPRTPEEKKQYRTMCPWYSKLSTRIARAFCEANGSAKVQAKAKIKTSLKEGESYAEMAKHLNKIEKAELTEVIAENNLAQLLKGGKLVL